MGITYKRSSSRLTDFIVKERERHVELIAKKKFVLVTSRRIGEAGAGTMCCCLSGFDLWL